MPLFSRKTKVASDPRPAIARFWAWWEEHRAEVIAAAVAQQTDTVATMLSEAVGALHPDLEWELGEGTSSRFSLTVSGGGKPELRALAERWWLAAPPADEDVEFSPVRRRAADLAAQTLMVEDFELPLAEFVAGTRLNRRRSRFDLLVHHPLFPLLSDGARAQACFLALDAALGEDDVERSVGAVEVAVDSPVDAIALDGLAAVVAQLRPAEGESWATFQAQAKQGPVVGMIRHPFARVDRPLADTHLVATLGYRPGEQGMPQEPDFVEQVGRLEQDALAALGGDGPHAVLVGHETGLGRCLVHFYVDGLEVDPEAVRPVLAGWPSGPARFESRHDPAWREIGHLLT